VLGVHGVHVKVLDALLQTEVVQVVEVQAAIGTSSVGTGHSEVHEVVADKTDEAASILSSLVGVGRDGGGESLILLDHRVHDICVVLGGKVGGGRDSSVVGAGEVLRWVVDVKDLLNTGLRNLRLVFGISESEWASSGG